MLYPRRVAGECQLQKQCPSMRHAPKSECDYLSGDSTVTCNTVILSFYPEDDEKEDKEDEEEEEEGRKEEQQREQ